MLVRLDPRQVAATAFVALVACGVAGFLASPADARGRELRVVRELRARIPVLERDLDRRRDELRRARTQGQGALALEARSRAGYESLQELLATAPTIGTPLEPTLGEDGYLGEAYRTARAEGIAAARSIERASEEAAIVQVRVDTARRQLRALEVASKGLKPGAEGSAAAAAYPATGWGGSDTAPVSARSIDRYLEAHASPMTGQGIAFMRAGWRWNIDPRLLVAISGAESYFGLQTCGRFNAWGWACPSSPAQFDSWADAVDVVAQGLREGYIDDGLTTVDEIHLRYAPPRASNDPNGLNFVWADNVYNFMVEQGGNPDSLEGPRSTGVTLGGD